MEFTYPLKLVADIPECRSSEGLLKGVIDLCFMHEGKYYVLDWKSNWLGESEEHYSEKELKQSILLNRYDLQATLYQRALEEYFAKIGCFETKFGGAIYFFLRGSRSYVL